MSYTSVFCIATSQAQTDYLVSQLRADHFPIRNISVLLADSGFSRWNRSIAAADCRNAGAGGGCGWIAGIGALPIPQAGPFVAAGPIIAAVCGPVPGTAMCGISGGLVALGIPANQAKRFEGRIRDGNFLVSVHTENSRQTAHAKGIFAHAGAHDLCCAGAAVTPPSRPVRAASQARHTAGYGV